MLVFLSNMTGVVGSSCVNSLKIPCVGKGLDNVIIGVGSIVSAVKVKMGKGGASGVFSWIIFSFFDFLVDWESVGSLFWIGTEAVAGLRKEVLFVTVSCAGLGLRGLC